MPRVSLQTATAHAADRDAVLAEAVARLGPLEHRPRDPDGPFGALVRAVVFQQLAGPAARAIYARVRATVGPTLSPETLEATPDDCLRQPGRPATNLASLRD